MEKHYCSIIDFDEEKKRLEETEFDKLWDEIYESYKNKMTYLEKNFNKEYTKSNLSSLILLHNEIGNKSIIIAYNKKNKDFCGAIVYQITPYYIHVDLLITVNMNKRITSFSNFHGTGTMLMNEVIKKLEPSHCGIYLEPLFENINFYQNKFGFKEAKGKYNISLINSFFYKNPKFDETTLTEQAYLFDFIDANLGLYNYDLLKDIDKFKNLSKDDIKEYFRFKGEVDIIEFITEYFEIFKEKFDNEHIVLCSKHIPSLYNLEKRKIQKIFQEIFDYCVKKSLLSDEDFIFIFSTVKLFADIQYIILNVLLKRHINPVLCYNIVVMNIHNDNLNFLLEYLKNRTDIISRKLYLKLSANKTKKRKFGEISDGKLKRKRTVKKKDKIGKSIKRSIKKRL
jgi:hypothetical protein